MALMLTAAVNLGRGYLGVVGGPSDERRLGIPSLGTSRSLATVPFPLGVGVPGAFAAAAALRFSLNFFRNS